MFKEFLQATDGFSSEPAYNLGLEVSLVLEKYTDKARRIIFFAVYEAGRFGSPSIEPELEERSPAAEILRRHGIQPDPQFRFE